MPHETGDIPATGLGTMNKAINPQGCSHPGLLDEADVLRHHPDIRLAYALIVEKVSEGLIDFVGVEAHVQMIVLIALPAVHAAHVTAGTQRPIRV